MKKLFALVSVFLASCGSVVDSPEPTSTSFTFDETVEIVRNNVFFSPQVGFCTEGWDDPTICEDGDSTMRNGQLCFSGEEKYCKFVKGSIGFDGRVWRSPLRVDNTWEITDTASRDQLLGVMLYLVKTHDTEAAKKVLDYIVTHDNTLCPVSSDSRCDVSHIGPVGPMWGIMRVVWNHIGLEPTWQMLASNAGDETTILAAASSVPAGYQMALVGNQILVYMHCGVFTTKLREAANILHRRDSGNPLYAWLAGQDVTQQFIDKAPKSVGRRLHWDMERPSELHNPDGDSMGGWLFLGNLIKIGAK